MAGHPLQDYDRADEAIVAFYLQSGDFNGMPSSALAHALGLDQEKLDDLLTVLVRREIASLSFGDRHPNPRIKAFEPQTIPEQLNKLSRLGTNHLCVYPTAERLKATVDPEDFSGQPFTLRLALGEPQLHLLSFDLTVLEKYRNDPRYYYTNNDVGGSIAARDAEKGVEMPEQDQVLLQTFGFSFDKELNRAVAVFLRYLAGLSREHQAIWNAHLLDGMYTCHPDYGRSSMGHWPEGISVFEAFSESWRKSTLSATALDTQSSSDVSSVETSILVVWIPASPNSTGVSRFCGPARSDDGRQSQPRLLPCGVGDDEGD